MTKGYSGWVVFAGVMLFIVGVLNVIYGIGAIADSSFFAKDQRYILGNLSTWGRWRDRCLHAPGDHRHLFRELFHFPTFLGSGTPGGGAPWCSTNSTR